MNDTEPDNGETAKKYDLLLPPDTGDGEYVLECWKVKEGTLVRTGETVALACLASVKKAGTGSESSSSPSMAAPPAADAKHKRPARRKRTAGAAPPLAPPNPAAGQKGDGELKSITLFPKATVDPTGKGKKDDSSTASKASTDTASEASKQPQSIPIAAPMTGFVRISGAVNSSTSAKAIGYIEPCSHPAVVDGLCGVCGMPMTRKDPSSISVSAPSGDDPSQLSSPRAMSQVTVSGGLTFTVSEQESIQIGKQNAQRLKDLKKLSLVLDLDHVSYLFTFGLCSVSHVPIIA